jgi:ABC-type phosphate/phosphonate transport system permease subunit
VTIGVEWLFLFTFACPRMKWDEQENISGNAKTNCTREKERRRRREEKASKACWQMNSLWEEKRRKNERTNALWRKMMMTYWILFFSFSFSFALCLNNVKNSHLSSFGLSWFFFYLKMLPSWSSSSSTTLTLVITQKMPDYQQ